MIETGLKQPITILLVDDHRTVLWGLQQLVESHPEKMRVVGTATEPHQAIALAKSLQPDVILLDIDLGQWNSLDFLPEFSSSSPARILMVTGVRDQMALDDAVKRGARGVVRKEEPAETLLQAIEKVAAGQLWIDRDATSRVFKALIEQEKVKSQEEDRMRDLTSKERQVIAALLADSTASNRVLAGRLSMSEYTFRNHLSAIYQKLQVENRMGLYLYASKHTRLQRS